MSPFAATEPFWKKLIQPARDIWGKSAKIVEHYYTADAVFHSNPHDVRSCHLWWKLICNEFGWCALLWIGYISVNNSSLYIVYSIVETTFPTKCTCDQVFLKRHSIGAFATQCTLILIGSYRCDAALQLAHTFSSHSASATILITFSGGLDKLSRLMLLFETIYLRLCVP